MDSVAAHPFLGVAMHAVGATFAATCYTPEKRVRGWSWQTYRITQASFCWFLLPILGAMLTTPQLAAVLFLTYGNYVGQAMTSGSETQTSSERGETGV